MAVKRSSRGKWMIDVCITLPDGRTERVRKVSPIQTKRAAQAFEREVRDSLLADLQAKDDNTQQPSQAAPEQPKPAPTLAAFAPEFLAYQATLNKPTELESKRSILEHHLVPAFGHLRLDQIEVRAIDRYKVAKLSPPTRDAAVKSTRRRSEAGLKPKTINNHLTVLSRALRVAYKWKLIDHTPEIEKLRVPKQPFDFLTFEDAEQFLAAAREHEPRWYPYLMVSIRTGLRVGEMLALRWADHVRLEQRQLRVELNYTRIGGVGSPKSDKAREVQLSWIPCWPLIVCSCYARPMGAPLDPEKLLHGDAATVAAFRAVLRSRILGFFHKESQVDEVTNDALVELLDKLKRGEKPTNGLYWALNAANNAIRRELTRMKRQAVVVYESRLHGIEEAGTNATLDARTELERLNGLLTQLGDVPRRVLVAAVQGDNHREIASEVGINPGAARQSLSRVRAQLRDHLTTQERRAMLEQLVQRAGLGHEPTNPVSRTLRPESSSSASSGA